MKKNRIIFSIFIILGLVACSDSFLDVEPQTSLSADMAISNFADAEVALMGVYEALQGSAAYYARDFVVTPDVSSDDVFIAPENSGRFLQQYNFTTTPVTGFVGGLWNRAYNGINRANVIISKIEILDDASEAQINNLLGQTLALRALMHFDLLRIFARPYSWDNGNSMGVPIMTEPGIGEPARDDVKDVYEQIILDLTDAYELLPADNATGAKAYFTKYAAKALLARVYLYMENWEKAAEYAVDVIDNGGYSLVATDDYVDSWILPFTSESIFSLPMSLIDYRATDALGYIYLRDGYGDLRPTQAIRDLLSAHGGVREEAFVTFDIIAEDYFVSKYPGRDRITGLDNVPVIRLSEMHLIAAEAYANINNDTDAQDHLNAIVQRADPDAGDIDLTGDELLERIYLEKRLEFAFEGHRAFDIARRQHALDRGECTAEICFLPARDYRFIFPIPQRELDANPNMEQNAGY